MHFCPESEYQWFHIISYCSLSNKWISKGGNPKKKVFEFPQSYLILKPWNCWNCVPIDLLWLVFFLETAPWNEFQVNFLGNIGTYRHGTEYGMGGAACTSTKLMGPTMASHAGKESCWLFLIWRERCVGVSFLLWVIWLFDVWWWYNIFYVERIEVTSMSCIYVGLIISYLQTWIDMTLPEA